MTQASRARIGFNRGGRCGRWPNSERSLRPISGFARAPDRTRCSTLQLGNLTINDQLGSSCEHRVFGEDGSAIDRNDPRPQHPLGMGHGTAVDPAIFGDPGSKSGQRAVGLGELQPAEAGRIDCGRGIGRGRVPGKRQNRAVRQVLLDLVGEGPVELPQYDADPRVEVPCEKSGVQIEMIVGRKRENRDRMAHPGAIQPLATIRAGRGNENCAYTLDGARQVRIPAPQDDYAMPLQRAKLLGRAERDRTTADDDHDRIVRLRHHRLPQSSASPGSGGYGCRTPALSSMIHSPDEPP